MGNTRDDREPTPTPDPAGPESGERILLSRKKKVFLAFVTLVFVFGVIEVGLRIAFPRIAWPSARVLWDGGASLTPDTSEWPTTNPKNASGVRTYIEFAVPERFNSDGFRDEEFDPAKGPVVILLGDSTTQGHGIEYEQTFAYRVEETLRERFGNVQVWNLGRSGSGPVVEIRLLERILAKYPTAQVEAVVLIAGVSVQNAAGNDLIDMKRNFAYLHGGRPDYTRPKSLRLRYIVRRSAILHGGEILVARWRRENWRMPRLADWDELWNMYFTCVDRLRAICDERGASIIAVHLAGLMSDEPADIEGITARMRAYFEPHGIRVVECAPGLAPELKGKLLYYPIDGHINTTAHEYCATLMAPVIADVISQRRAPRAAQ